MTVSVVLRLVERALAGGRLAGEAEIVESGTRQTIRDGEELVAFLQGIAGARAVPGGSERQHEGSGGGCGVEA